MRHGEDTWHPLRRTRVVHAGLASLGLLESLSTKATAQLRVLEPFVVELRVERAWCEYNVIKCDCANIKCNGHIGTLGNYMCGKVSYFFYLTFPFPFPTSHFSLQPCNHRQASELALFFLR